jgi:hypothetical protein
LKGQQYVSRRDMWRIVLFLDSKPLYKGKTMQFEGIQFKVRSLTKQGLVNKEVKEVEVFNGVFKRHMSLINFNSNSAQKYILIEMSQEMYSFDDSSFLFAEKAVHFLWAYFDR